MPRIKITVPNFFVFSCIIPIRITDINYGGHVGNDSILGIIHEARIQFLKHYGYSEIDMAGVGLIMSDVAIEFKKEAFLADIITVFVMAQDFKKAGFDINYQLTKTISKKKIIIANAKTGMFCFNYETRKITSIPEEVIKKMA